MPFALALSLSLLCVKRAGVRSSPDHYQCKGVAVEKRLSYGMASLQRREISRNRRDIVTAVGTYVERSLLGGPESPHPCPVTASMDSGRVAALQLVCIQNVLPLAPVGRCDGLSRRGMSLAPVQLWRVEEWRCSPGGRVLLDGRCSHWPSA